MLNNLTIFEDIVGDKCKLVCSRTDNKGGSFGQKLVTLI